MQLKRKIMSGVAIASLVALGSLGFMGAAGASESGNQVTIAAQVSSTPSVANADPAWGGFINPAGTAGTTTGTVGETVQVLVTSIQTAPDPYAGTGSFSVEYNPAQLTFTTDKIGRAHV